MIKVGDIFTCKKTLTSGNDYELRFIKDYKYVLIRINEQPSHTYFFRNEVGNEHWFNINGLKKWFMENKFKYGK